MKRKIILILVLVLAISAGYYYWGTMGGEMLPPTESQNRMMMRDYDIKDKSDVSLGIMGKWKSADDLKFEEEFITDGLITFYDGLEVSKDVYEFYNTVDVPGEAVPNLVNNSVYLKVSNKDAGDLWYRIVKLDGNTLEMFYEGKGNLLKFTRVIPPNV